MNYIFRKANLNDTDFIVKSIVAAEKSGTEQLGLSKILDLEESLLAECLMSILEEEIDGCELSISSFMVAECDNRPVAAFGGWIEGLNEDGLPSSILKANLLGYTMPPSSIRNFAQHTPMLKSLQIEREPGTLQLEYAFTHPLHRGQGLIGQIIDRIIQTAKEQAPQTNKCQVQLFGNNIAAINCYQKAGFTITQQKESQESKILEFLPYHSKLLMEKKI